MSPALISSPRWIVFFAARTSSVLVVALHAQAPRRQPIAVMTTAATTRPGRLRSLGGGVSGAAGSVAVARGPGLRSSRAVVVIRRTSSRSTRQFTSTCASPIRIWVERVRPSSRIVPVWPAPDHVMTQLEVAVTVYASSGLPALEFL